MTQYAVIIKHPGRSWDWRIDLFNAPNDIDPSKIKEYCQRAMLGPFEVMGVTSRIGNREIKELVESQEEQ